MKRVISALAVIAIVSGALAFKTKPTFGLYCASTTANQGCQVVQKREASGPNNIFIKPNFNGITCPVNDCAQAIRLVDEQ